MSTSAFSQAGTLPVEKKFTLPVISKFLNWSKNQEENRILWVCIALAVHGCALTPLTVLAVAFAGMNLYLFMLALIAMSIALVTNLAAMPTKYTIPAFALSVVMDIVIIAVTCITGFNLV
jgi:hypothetical protein